MHWNLDVNKKYERTNIQIETSEITDDIIKLTTYIDQLSQTMIVKKENEQTKITLLNIIYIETVERTTFIYTKRDIYEMESALYELEKKLTTFGFIRINKHTLLNPRNIQSVKALLNSRFELLLETGEKLIVTRHYRKSFKRIFEKGGFYDA